VKQLMRVFPGNVTHVGQRRDQQDAYGLSNFADGQFIDHGGYLALVADGIGGMEYGAVASSVAVEAFLGRYLAKSVLREVDETLDGALLAANRAVLEEAERRDCLENMGTTLVAAVIYEGFLYWRSVGDSHLYLFRGGRLGQVNADHNFASTLQAWVADGLISQNMADLHPDRATLESFIGLNEIRHIDSNRVPLPLQDGDLVMLCSDGVYGCMTDEEIMSCLTQEPMLAAKQLADAVLAKQLPHQDNLTAVVLHYRSSRKANGNEGLWLLRFWLYLALLGSIVLSAGLLLLNR
jgi:protein phosphatase